MIVATQRLQSAKTTMVLTVGSSYRVVTGRRTDRLRGGDGAKVNRALRQVR
jgi:hypothetical protein